MDKCKCAICGCDINDWGNNPWPIRKDEDARCCDDCNSLYVIPARIKMMGMEKDKHSKLVDMLDAMSPEELNNVLL